MIDEPFIGSTSIHSTKIYLPVEFLYFSEIFYSDVLFEVSPLAFNLPDVKHIILQRNKEGENYGREKESDN
jgi:hypothetical protein